MNSDNIVAKFIILLTVSETKFSLSDKTLNSENMVAKIIILFSGLPYWENRDPTLPGDNKLDNKLRLHGCQNPMKKKSGWLNEDLLANISISVRLFNIHGYLISNWSNFETSYDW